MLFCNSFFFYNFTEFICIHANNNPLRLGMADSPWLALIPIVLHRYILESLLNRIKFAYYGFFREEKIVLAQHEHIWPWFCDGIKSDIIFYDMQII